MSHSFVYGRAVNRDEFVNRRSSLQTVFNRVENRESTAIVGEPHIGKTSLLKLIADHDIQEQYLGSKSKSLTCSYIDLLPQNNEFTTERFWQIALYSLAKQPGTAQVSKMLKEAFNAKFQNRSVEKVFYQLEKENRRVLLLLDEFDRLLVHPSFQDASFFAGLRSFCTQVGGVCVVTATRKNLAEINQLGRGLLSMGSPLFNFLSQEVLKPFSPPDVEVLLNRAGAKFSYEDKLFIRRVAGKHPFLIQAMAASLLESDGTDRYSQAAQKFYERISSHFDDLWTTMDDATRTTSVILSIIDLGGLVLGKDFSYGEIENISKFEPQLQELFKRGLAEKFGDDWEFDLDNLLLWRGGRWGVSAQAYSWWVRDVVVARTRKFEAYDEWLYNKCYTTILTQQQWDSLQKAIQKMPNWASKGIDALVSAILSKLTIRK